MAINERIRFWYHGEKDPTSWYDLDADFSFLKNVFVDKVQIKSTLTKAEAKTLYPELFKEM